MGEIRRDPVSGRWVIIATDRAARPRDFFVSRRRKESGFCPFCEGNEDRTPPEIAAVRPGGGAPNTPGWKVRVVPNKFPALRLDQQFVVQGSGLYQAVSGFGVHEVVIESADHVTSPTEMPPEDYRLVIETYRRRAALLGSDDRLAYVLIFKNVGVEAGASIEHSHSQLIAVPVMPKRVHEEMASCHEFFAERSECLFCDIIRQELDAGERVALESERFVVLSPYAARFPFELWLLPKEHEPHFYELSDESVSDLTDVLQETLARLEICLQEPPYNFAVHTAPVTGKNMGHFHWHVEVIPRVTEVAGFEWGTGFYINPMEPESAAEHLRGVPLEQVREKLTGSPLSEQSKVGSQPPR
jgi:UDPglucose--hexose-1-phosphate uridylyltransferase